MSHPLRYTFILGLVALATALAAVGGWRFARASAPVNGPIVLVSVDSLRADRLPIYGYKAGSTPALDRLAADGVVFDRAYAHVPLTLPAHASILTGRLPYETGVRDNVGSVVKPDERLISEVLRDRGFATGAVVSSYLLRRETGINQGFSFFDDTLPLANPDDPETLVRSLTRPGLEAERAAERWLNTADSSRLFLFLHLDEPLPDEAEGDGAQANLYDKRVAAADAAIARLVRYLKAHQLYDQSTIIIVADHGEGLGDHGEQEHGLLVYDENLRVPLIVKQAAGEGAGRRIKYPVQQIDLAPTILDLAKAPGSGALPGQSLTPLLEGGSSAEPRTIYAESLYALHHFGWSGLLSLTDGRYRFISGPVEELYDLDTDPGENQNLIDVAPASVVENFRREAKKRAVTDRIELAQVPTDAWTRLEALGNVGRQSWLLPAPGVNPRDKIDTVERYRAAVRLAAARMWAPAIDAVRDLLKEEPERVDLWTKLAEYQTGAGRSDQAAAAYRRVLELAPQDTSARLGLARSLFAVRKLSDAVLEAEAVATQEEPDSVSEQLDARLLLVEIALARPNAIAARERAVRAAELDTRLPLLDYVEGRLLLDRGLFEEAAALLEHAAGVQAKIHDRQIPSLQYYRGEAFSRLRRYEDAKVAYLEAVAADPDDVRPRASLAVTYRKLNQLDDAGAAVAAMLRVSPTAETYRLAASLHGSFGDERRAAEILSEAQRRFGVSPSARSTQ
ncbi:MAG TPA: sulfatase-like hydrolase/transferase [Vicinamibacterales bacterium]|nr:sulfatase-like hydrolase/transferase [Vicinamibacterales bacterium]